MEISQMEISHLVVAGCSWTYCQGINFHKLKGWPALLAKKLNVPVVNLALPGLGNDAIHRRTYEYFFEDLPNNNNPFYVIAWSQLWRREAWCRQYYQKNRPNNYCIISMPNDLPENPYEQAILDNWSDEDFYRRTVKYRLSIQSLFKAHNTPYFESFFSNDQFLGYDILSERFAGITKALESTKNRLQNFQEIVAPYPNLPCGHHGYESMPVLADYIYNELIQRYGQVKSVNKNYLKLKDYHRIDNFNTNHDYWE